MENVVERGYFGDFLRDLRIINITRLITMMYACIPVESSEELAMSGFLIFLVFFGVF